MKGLLSKLQSIWVLLSLAGISLLFLSVGSAFGYLSEDIFFNLDWRGFLTIGALPLVLGLGFLLSSLSDDEKEFHRKMWYLYLLTVLLGIVLYAIGALAYNSLIDASTQTALGVDYVFYLLVGLVVTSLGSVLFVTAMNSSREKIWSLRFLWIIIALVGLFLAIAGIAAQAMTPVPADKNLLGIMWDDYLLLAGVPLVFGSIMFLGSKPHEEGSFLWKFKYPGLLVFLAGLLLLIAAPVVFFIDTTQHIDPVLSMPWNDWFLFSLFPLGIGLALVVAPASENAQELFSKLKVLFLLLVIGGLLSYMIGVLEYAEGFSISDMPWGDWVLLGTALALVGIVFIYKFSVNEEGDPSALSRPVIQTGRSKAAGVPSERSIVSKLKLKPQEQLTYYRIAKKIALYSKEQYKSAKKDGEFSPAAFNALIAKMDEAIVKHDNSIKAVKRRSERKDRKRLFEQELGIAEKSKPSPEKPTLEIQEPSSPATAAPPPLQRPGTNLSPQPSSPPPLQKPKIIETRPTPPPVTPITPKSTGIPPSSPVTPSSTPQTFGTQSPDVVGTARSTSIAELRGEMLKELRRLRDIFKDEE